MACQHSMAREVETKKHGVHEVKDLKRDSQNAQNLQYDAITVDK